MNSTKPVVALLLLLQAVSAIYLWTITLTGALSAGRFAIFLAIDMLSFTIVAYVYTHEKWEEAVSRVWVLIGAIGLVILLVSSLYLS